MSTPLDVPTLRRTFDLVRPRAAAFAVDFYSDLFARFPETVQLFANVDMERQRMKLMDTLVLVIEHLDRGDVLHAALTQLGRQHAGWRIHARHYDMVGAALLGALAKHLGAEWTAEVERAWTAAYGTIAAVMIAAGESPAGAPTA